MVKSNNKSFTLIEILVVTSIIILLSGTSLAIFSSFRDDKVLDNQVTLLTHQLELAKSEANAGDVALCSSSTSAHVAGYSVAVSTSTITLLPECDTTPTPQSYPIPSNVVYITPTFSVRFDNQNYQGGTRKFPIKNTDTNKCKFVQIDETGLVTSGDLPCP